MQRLVLFPALILALFITAASAAGDKRLTIEDALALKTIGAPQFAPDGKRLAYTVSEWDRKENRRVTHIYLVTTDGGKSSMPSILQIHGGPYGKFSDTFNARNQIWAANGYAVLMPNPRGSTGYGNKFTVANLNDWGGKDFQDIMAGVDAVIARGLADPDKCVVMGGSYGGFMTFWTVSQTDRFKAAIGHAAISDWYSFHGQSDIPGLMEYGFKGTPWDVPENYRRWSPMTYVSKVKTPLMITHGERDMRVNIQQGEQYYRALKKRGVEVVFYRYPREGHGIQEPNHVIDLTARQLEWFDSHLGIKREKPAEVKAAGASGTN